MQNLYNGATEAEQRAAQRKVAVLAALRTFARQRSGIEWGNYGGDGAAYRSEVRSITKDLTHATALLRAVQLRSISADDIIRASQNAYSGRLTLTERATPEGGFAFAVGYCAGQYFPTEYRRAVCAVLASALWDYVRTQCMPKPGSKNYREDKPGQRDEHGGRSYAIGDQWCTAGDWLRRHFAREFGRGIASRWFS